MRKCVHTLGYYDYWFVIRRQWHIFPRNLRSVIKHLANEDDTCSKALQKGFYIEFHYDVPVNKNVTCNPRTPCILNSKFPFFFWRTLRCSYFCSFSWGVVALSSEHKLFTCIVIHFHWIRCDFQAYISVTSETIEMTRWWLFQSCSRLNGKHNDDIGQHQHQFHFNESERIGKKKSANRFIFILNCVVHLKRPEMLNILKFLCHFWFFSTEAEADDSRTTVPASSNSNSNFLGHSKYLPSIVTATKQPLSVSQSGVYACISLRLG